MCFGGGRDRVTAHLLSRPFGSEIRIARPKWLIIGDVFVYLWSGGSLEVGVALRSGIRCENLLFLNSAGAWFSCAH
jgi:hypothetical protein